MRSRPAVAGAASLVQRASQVACRRPYRRRDPGNDGADERRAERKGEDHPVDAGVLQPRDSFRGIRDERRHGKPRQYHSERAADRGQDQRFGEELAHDSAAARTNGGAHRHLPRADAAAREQKVGDVAARDQQHEGDGAEQHEQTLAVVADELLVERLRARPD